MIVLTNNRMIVGTIIIFILAIVFSFFVDKLGNMNKRWFLLAEVLLIMWLTIFAKKVTVREINLTPLWSYRRIGDAFLTCEIALNIALFVPYGALLYSNLKNTSLVKVIIIGCVTSAVIEIIQFIFALGLCEVDDIISNTLGTIIGCCIVVLNGKRSGIR